MCRAWDLLDLWGVFHDFLSLQQETWIFEVADVLGKNPYQGFIVYPQLGVGG